MCPRLLTAWRRYHILGLSLPAVTAGIQTWAVGTAVMPFEGWSGSDSDEGRAKLRKARGRCKDPVNPGLPNGTSQNVMF